MLDLFRYLNPTWHSHSWFLVFRSGPAHHVSPEVVILQQLFSFPMRESIIAEAQCVSSGVHSEVPNREILR